MTFPLASERVRGTAFRAKLDRFETVEDLEAFLAANPQPRFAFYKDRTQRKRGEFESVIDHLGLDLSGVKHLDIGPAYGETLDISVNERGAERADFIELDDVFYTWNRLKRLGNAYRGNYLTVVSKLPASHYGSIYVRGLPQIETIWPLRNSMIEFVRVDRWIDRLASLLAPGGTAILSPNWRSHAGRRTETPDWASHPFCDMMRSKGFTILPYLDQHNQEPENPVTFVLRKP